MSAYVTYLAPEGDELTVSWLGYTFNDGEPVEVTNEHLITKARGNQWFDVEEVAKASEAVEVLEKRRPGRPRKVVVPVVAAEADQAPAVEQEAPAEPPVDNAEVGA